MRKIGEKRYIEISDSIFIFEACDEAWSDFFKDSVIFMYWLLEDTFVFMKIQSFGQWVSNKGEPLKKKIHQKWRFWGIFHHNSKQMTIYTFSDVSQVIFFWKSILIPNVFNKLEVRTMKIGWAIIFSGPCPPNVLIIWHLVLNKIPVAPKF